MRCLFHVFFFNVLKYETTNEATVIEKLTKIKWNERKKISKEIDWPSVGCNRAIQLGKYLTVFLGVLKLIEHVFKSMKRVLPCLITPKRQYNMKEYVV